MDVIFKTLMWKSTFREGKLTLFAQVYVTPKRQTQGLDAGVTISSLSAPASSMCQAYSCNPWQTLVWHFCLEDRIKQRLFIFKHSWTTFWGLVARHLSPNPFFFPVVCSQQIFFSPLFLPSIYHSPIFYCPFYCSQTKFIDSVMYLCA